jgi:hypothetical protein
LYRRGHSGSKPKPWFERDGGEILRAEQGLVQAHYPSLTFRADTEAGRMYLEGQIALQANCGVATSIAVRISFPPNYPESEPTAYDAVGRFPVSVDRHIISEGRFCLWLPPCSPWDKNDPSRLLRFLDEVSVFLERQLVYDATGHQEWPGRQYKHGTAGYEEFMLARLANNEEDFRSLLPVILGQLRPGRNEPCPCGSQQKYKRCHANSVADIISRIGRNTLDFLYKRPNLQNPTATMM